MGLARDRAGVGLAPGFFLCLNHFKATLNTSVKGYIWG